jgi:ubiquitin-like 1-activating enzyme E1 B
LFGEDEDAGGELDAAEQQGENGTQIDRLHTFLINSICTIAQEIATLRKEAKAFKVVRDALRSPSTDVNRDAAKMVFQKVGLPVCA